MELKLGLDPFFMKVFRYFPIILGVGALVACGGSKPAPVVDPVASPVNAPAVNEPVVPDLVPVPEPKSMYCFPSSAVAFCSLPLSRTMSSLP